MPDRRPRILQIGPDPETRGGMPAALRGLQASSLSDSYRLEVVPSYRGRQPLARLGVFYLALLRLTAWSLRRRGRIVHIHVTVRGSAYRKSICVLLAKALRRRVVLHVHAGPAEIAAFRDSCGKFGLALIRRSLAAADSVLAVSAASAKAMHRVGVSVEIGVVPNVPPSIPSIHRTQFKGGEVTVAYLGGFFTPAKGGDVLIDALPLVLERTPPMRVVLAGPGEPPKAAMDLVAGQASVEWISWLDDDRKDALLKRAEVLLMPSRSEGQPIALLEAMGYGLAIIATSVGGIPETLKDGEEGLLVPPEDSAALADALCGLVQNPTLRRQLGDAARLRIEALDEHEVPALLASLYASLT